MREENSKHWERKYLGKAAATAYLCEIIMVQNRDQRLPLCSWKGKLGKQKEKKEVDVYNCYFRICLLVLQGKRSCSGGNRNNLKRQQLSTSSLWASKTRIF